MQRLDTESSSTLKHLQLVFFKYKFLALSFMLQGYLVKYLNMLEKNVLKDGELMGQSSKTASFKR